MQPSDLKGHSSHKFKNYALKEVNELNIELTEAGKTLIQEHYPRGIVYDYDVDKPIKLLSWALKFIEIIYLGIPYRIPNKIDGKPTIRMETS